MALEKFVPAQPPATARMASLSISLLSLRSFIWMLAIGIFSGLTINKVNERVGGDFIQNQYRRTGSFFVKHP